MLAWLVLFLSAIAGWLAGQPDFADRLETAPGLPAAIMVTAALSVLYLLTFRRGNDEASWLRTKASPIVAFLATVIASMPALKSAGLWPKLQSEHGANEVRPARAVPAGRAAVRIRRGEDGRFAAQGAANGSALRLVIDTGAAAVMLKASDAEAAGIDVSSLTFDTAIETAGGTAYIAPVRLSEVAVGPIVLGDVECFVAKPGSLNESLLGMSFLRRLASYDLAGDFMTLRQ